MQPMAQAVGELGENERAPEGAQETRSVPNSVGPALVHMNMRLMLQNEIQHQ